MRTSYLTMAIVGLTILGGAPAVSQSQMAGAMQGPKFLPSGMWVVQPNQMASERGLDKLNLPCMMAGSYDNGYSLRFSGTQGNILAMAIDFRQDVFTRGRKYPARMTVGNGQSYNVSGTAFSNNALLFNMRDIQGLHGALSGARSLSLNVQDNPMTFELSNMGNALRKLDMCYTGGVSGPVQEIAATPTMNDPSSEAVAMGYDKQPAWNAKVSPVPARVSRDIRKAEQAKGQVWQAKAGDDLRNTLNGWASRAGVELDWQATGQSKLVSDIAVQGDFEEAVQALMAQNATALGLDANMMGKAGQMRPTALHRASATSQSSAISSIASKARSNYVAGGKWSAATGTSLQKVLQDWSKKAGVEFVWESGQGFVVRAPVSSNGSYEDALRALLSQYEDQKIRPAAQLNNDPNTGRRVLFVQASRV